MAYATQADLTPSVIPGETLVELTDDLRSGEVDVTIVQTKLDDASGIVEMHCRERYALPLKQTPELTAITVKIAAFLLYSRRAGEVPDGIRTNYDDTLKLLTSVAAEKIGLDQPLNQQQQGAAGTVARSRKSQVFSHRNMNGFA